MKDEVAVAIAAGIIERRELLQSLTLDQQTTLLEKLFMEFFGDLHTTLQKWAALTGQTAQVDTGYIAQFVASIVLKEPGQGFRGKGDDLADGSEVKSAAIISGVDRPRWNHNMGTPAQDRTRSSKGKVLASDEYLESPYLFYLLADRSASDTHRPRAIRIRGWLIDAENDSGWRDLLRLYQSQKADGQYNLQLHPPVAYDDDIVVNTLGNLDFSEVLVFDARVLRSADDASPLVQWVKPLEDDILPQVGRTRAIAYGGRGSRPSRLTGASDLVADIAVVAHLFPDVLGDEQADRLAIASAREVTAEAETADDD
ncbi:MamI family restriction endonuclease [Nocardioides sp.]|uniref:MamI family restriction endonuclease n=1 Tax=Nocardioides sp. TaxID=35761 RepID=UPI0026228298|nr:MamI family restriction endonuclease [Nocardioides sp.]